jgi:hypothetical protein
MFGYIAVLLFIIAFILRVTGTGTGVVFAPESLLLAAWHSSRCKWRCGRVADHATALNRALGSWWSAAAAAVMATRPCPCRILHPSLLIS